MAERTDAQLFKAVSAGDATAFERVYELYRVQTRLAAWRLSHRADWVDDLTNEAWCRAFDHRTTYNSDRPFLVWMAGILRNVYREFCRKSVPTLGATPGSRPPSPEDIDALDPHQVAAEAELLFELNACVETLDDLEARIIRLRFFEGKSLKVVAQEVCIPESTLREARLPAVLARLRRCLERKDIDFSRIFSALGPG